MGVAANGPQAYGEPVQPSGGAATARAGKRRALACVAGAVAALGLWAATPAFAGTGLALAGSVADPTSLSGIISVAVAGNYAYAPASNAGVVAAIDISNPAQPTIAGTSAYSPGLVNAANITIANGYAYVVSKNRNGTNGTNSNDDGTGNSLTILDITTDPAHPQIVGTLKDAFSLFGAYGIAVQGAYAYVAAQGCLTGQPCPNASVGNSLVVVDVSTPSAPTIVGSVVNSTLPAPWAGTNALWHATSVAVSGNYAYVTAAYANRLTVLDISDPHNPIIVASLLDSNRLSFDVDVAVQNGYAYVADQTNGLGRMAVVDVRNPLQPLVAGMITNSTWLNGAYRVKVRGNFAYVAGLYSAAVSAIDISNPQTPLFLNGYQSPALLNRNAGLDLDPSSRYAVAVSPYLSSQSQSLYPPYSLQPGGATNTGTVTLAALDPSPLTVSINTATAPPNPTTQTAASFTFTASDDVAYFRCQLDSDLPTICSASGGQSYSGIAPGTHTFRVSAIDPAQNTANAAYTWTINASPPAPPPSTPVLDNFNRSNGAIGSNWGAIFGGFTNFQVNGQQAVDPSSGSFAWNFWQQQQFGPNSEVYATMATTSNDAVRVCARMVNPTTNGRSGYCAQVSGSTWSLIRIDNGTSTTLATTIQTVAAGDRLGLSVSGTALAAWYRPVGSGTWTRLLIAADSQYPTAGYLSVEARASHLDDFGGGTSPTAPQNTVAPSITGSTTAGQTLNADAGSWSGNPAPTYSYQWHQCDAAGQNCQPITGATTSSYQTLAGDAGHQITVTVTASNSAGQNTATATPVGPIQAAAPAGPLLDNFNRASGALGSNWGLMFGGFSSFQINGQQAVDPSATSFAWSFWQQQFGPNTEVYATMATTSADAVRVCARMISPTTSSRSGYCAQVSGSNWSLIRIDNGVSASLATATHSVAAGDKLGLTITGSTLTAWYQAGSNTWTRLLTTTDTRYSGVGYLSMEARATHLDDFGGRTIP